jgi:hypothetical protein
MDNRTIDVVSEGDDDLKTALKLIWPNASSGKATHYKVVRLREKVSYYGKPTDWHDLGYEEDPDGTPTLILLWSAEKDAPALPYAMDRKQAAQFVLGWLGQADYGSEPDHDGDNDRGWRVFTDKCGHVVGHQYGIVGVQPAWAQYGK